MLIWSANDHKNAWMVSFSQVPFSHVYIAPSANLQCRQPVQRVEKKTKAFVKWRGGRSYIEFSNVSFCGGRRRIRFCVVCCVGVPVRLFSVIFVTYMHIYTFFYSNIPLPYLWYVWVENIKNQSWNVTRILDQCRILFMWSQLCCVYLLNCTQPAMVTVEIDLSHGHVIEECHIMPRTLCSRACLKLCHVPFPCNVLTSANLLIYSKSIFFFRGKVLVHCMS